MYIKFFKTTKLIPYGDAYFLRDKKFSYIKTFSIFAPEF